MSVLTQRLLDTTGTTRPHIERFASTFSAAEIRFAIAELVAGNHIDIASALCEAGLSLYPESEDILSICALLAELKQDWQSAQEHLEKLLDVQGRQSQAMVWQHLIRVVRCQLEPLKALKIAQAAAKIHPDNALIQTELKSLLDEQADQIMTPVKNMTH